MNTSSLTDSLIIDPAAILERVWNELLPKQAEVWNSSNIAPVVLQYVTASRQKELRVLYVNDKTREQLIMVSSSEKPETLVKKCGAAIRFSPVSSSLLIPADVLTDSRRDTILISNLGSGTLVPLLDFFMFRNVYTNPTMWGEEKKAGRHKSNCLTILPIILFLCLPNMSRYI